MAMGNEGLIGFKKEDYVEPKEILGESAPDLPSDIRFFLKRNKTPAGGVQKKVLLYELIREEGGLKLRLDHVASYLNRIPDEDEIALNFGPSEEGYKWIAKWLNANGEEVGVQSETIRVSEKWRARYEEAQKLKAQVSEAAKAATPAPVVVAAPSSNAMGPEQMLALIREGEDRAVKMMERMASVMKMQEGPSAVMEKAYDAVGRFMEKTMESNMMIARKVADAAKESIDAAARGPEDEDEDEEIEEAAAPKSDGMPAWLAPIMEKASMGLGQLLGGGPTGAVVKSLILGSEEWKQIFGDKEKFETMTRAMREEYGEEKVKKAMDILLNVRPEKTTKAKKAGK